MRSEVALKCTDKAASSSRLMCYGDFKQSNSKGFNLFCSYKQIPTLICNQKAIALEQKKSLEFWGKNPNDEWTLQAPT